MKTIKEKYKKLKAELYRPKPYKLMCGQECIDILWSHKAAKRALHYKCEELKKYPILKLVDTIMNGAFMIKYQKRIHLSERQKSSVNRNVKN